jgi:hypothetical protein
VAAWRVETAVCSLEQRIGAMGGKIQLSQNAKRLSGGLLSILGGKGSDCPPLARKNKPESAKLNLSA